jgi:hypothetical protein
MHDFREPILEDAASSKPRKNPCGYFSVQQRINFICKRLSLVPAEPLWNFFPSLPVKMAKNYIQCATSPV